MGGTIHPCSPTGSGDCAPRRAQEGCLLPPSPRTLPPKATSFYRPSLPPQPHGSPGSPLGWDLTCSPGPCPSLRLCPSVGPGGRREPLRPSASATRSGGRAEEGTGQARPGGLGFTGSRQEGAWKEQMPQLPTGRRAALSLSLSLHPAACSCCLLPRGAAGARGRIWVTGPSRTLWDLLLPLRRSS